MNQRSLIIVSISIPTYKPLKTQPSLMNHYIIIYLKHHWKTLHRYFNQTPQPSPNLIAKRPKNPAITVLTAKLLVPMPILGWMQNQWGKCTFSLYNWSSNFQNGRLTSVQCPVQSQNARPFPGRSKQKPVSLTTKHHHGSNSCCPSLRSSSLTESTNQTKTQTKGHDEGWWWSLRCDQ